MNTMVYCEESINDDGLFILLRSVCAITVGFVGDEDVIL